MYTQTFIEFLDQGEFLEVNNKDQISLRVCTRFN